MSLMTIMILVFRVVLGLFFGCIAMGGFVALYKANRTEEQFGDMRIHMIHAYFALMLLVWFL